ncbi:MAG: ankyrin repeat domain-containing protein [Bacteroidota bacterium]
MPQLPEKALGALELQVEELDWEFIGSFMELIDSREPMEEIKTFLYTYVGETRRLHLLEVTYLWNRKEYTALHYAAEEGYLEVVDHVIQDYHLPVDMLTKSKKVTPLQCAAVRGHGSVVVYLISQGANVNYQNSAGLSVLHYAISGRSYGIVATLIDQGAKVDIEGDEDNFNLLHAAVEPNMPDLVELIMVKAREQGTDVLKRMLSQHTKAHGVTPLEFAQYVGATHVCPKLLEAGAQLGITDRMTSTSQHSLCSFFKNA